MSDQTKAAFFQLNLTRTHKKIGEVPFSLQQGLEPVNTLITKWSSEARPFRRLSNYLFKSQ